MAEIGHVSNQRALLVDIDSTIPNLALMHISSKIKSEGGTASFRENKPTHAYVSCIFPRNRNKAFSASWMLKSMYPKIEVDVGGTGVSFVDNILDPDAPIMPDYSLYPKNDMSLGFSSRGCDRRCYLEGINCIVPLKEGKYRRTAHPKYWHNPEFKKIMLFDNNVLIDKPWFFEITDWMIQENLKVDFNQGLDIRLIDKDVAARLAELRPIGSWHFAFDSMSYEKSVEKGIEMLKNAGIRPKNTMWYLYMGTHTTESDAVARCQILRKHSVVPFPMIDGDIKLADRPRWMTKVKGWCRPEIFFSCEYDECTRGKPKWSSPAFVHPLGGGVV